LTKVLITLGIICIAVAGLTFLGNALRMGFLMARANVGLWEAVILAVLGLGLILTSRRR